MYLTDLDDTLRAAGCKVVEIAGWQNRGHGGFTQVQTVVPHHTAGPKTGNMPSLNVVTHGRPGLSGPLCNIGLGRDGTCYVVAAGVAYHAGKVGRTAHDNWHAIGIEAEATGTSAWPKAQYDAYVLLCAALVRRYGLNVGDVLGHKEIAVPSGRKIDPNFDMAEFRRDVAAKERQLAQPAPARLTSKSPRWDALVDDMRALLASLPKQGAVRRRVALTSAIALVRPFSTKHRKK